MSEEKNTEYKMTPAQKLENFWYHYKWHTLILLFFVLVITVCTIQLCERNSYDVYVMYAGGGELDRKSNNGDFPEYQKALSSLGKYAGDYDGDGNIAVELLALFVPSEEQIAQIQADGRNVNYALIYDNSSVLSDNMLHSNYYLCFLSEELFLKYCAEEAGVFEQIGKYTEEGAEYEHVNEYGIRLSSLPLYSRDGIRNLPSDTVVCIRRLGAVSTRFDKKAQTAFERAETLLEAILKK